MKKPRELERIIKGCSNHRRIEMLITLERMPEQNLLELSETLKINMKTGSDHLRRLAIAGLVMKRHEGASVRHALTSRGKIILKFLRTLE